MHIFVVAIVALVSMIPLALAGSEVRQWVRTRRNAPHRVHDANRRLLRRGLGCVLLLTILILLVFPPASWLSPLANAGKLLACLLLCLVVIVLSFHDVHAIRGELARDVQDLRDKSARELHPSSGEGPETQAGREAPKY